MIANRLMMCCIQASRVPAIFLANFSGAADGSSLSGAVTIGEYYSSPGCEIASGRLVIQPGGYFNCYNSLPGLASVGADDFVIDLLFDGPETPAIDIGAGSARLMAPYLNQQIITWDGVAIGHEITVSPVAEPPSSHHVAIGRQAGVVQCWVDGARMYSSADGASGAMPMTGTQIAPRSATALQLSAARVARGNIYGDSATITVPTLPLGII